MSYLENVLSIKNGALHLLGKCFCYTILTWLNKWMKDIMGNTNEDIKTTYVYKK